MTTTEIQKHEPANQALVRASDYELSVEELVSQVEKIQQVMARVMREGEHYGVIPGTNRDPKKKPKRTLHKSGAEKLLLVFRLDPQFEIDERREGLHLTIVSKCVLYHIPTGLRRGSGMGSCSSRESKYAYRKGARSCPECGCVDTIIQGREEYGGGWLCFAKKGGCGSKFRAGDAAIEAQEVGRVANDDLADTENTVLKMANKRALVAAILNVTAASDIFSQAEPGEPRHDDEPDDDEPEPVDARGRPAAPKTADSAGAYLTAIVEAGSLVELEQIAAALKQATGLTEPQQKALRESWANKRTELQKRAANAEPAPRREFGDAQYRQD